MGERLRIADRYVVNDPKRDLLGRGGMGDVYRGTDTRTGETVAVKALNPDLLARDPALLERFLREGEALRRLNHPNIVHSIAAGEENGRHYLVMGYVGGGSLEGLLEKQGRLPAERAIEIGLDLADALTRAHRLGILHRDLKPANVLLAPDGTPRLADFGIAHVAVGPQLTQTGVLIGTVDYLSPEACQGEPLDERADIWAFGVLLFEMLAGRLPFEGQSLTAKLTAILTQPVPDLQQLAPDLSEGLVDLVYRMLEKDRHQRIPSMRLVGAELEALLKGREPTTPSRAAKTRFQTPAPDANVPKHNLPTQTTPFVGRQAELCELARLLDDPDVHLLTIVGLGGMGKTRLALELGAAQVDKYADGVYFVSLAPIQTADLIVPTVAQALGFAFRPAGDPRQQLLDYLHPKRMLLILDNWEHLLACPAPGRGDGASLVGEILQSATRVQVLATSRLRLGVPEEHLYHLAGVDFPEQGSAAAALSTSAVRLFLQGARRARPGWEPAAGDLQAVAHICRLVEGMPLAILLAAAWVEMLTPAEIAAETQHSLDFVQTEAPGVADRQRSIRAVFDHAWSLLTMREHRVLPALSVFRGGFLREAAQQVASASLLDLMGLVNKSLVYRAPTGRFDIHELLRQYAAEKLVDSSESEAVRRRHADFFLALAELSFYQIHGPMGVDWVRRLAAENGNLRAALDWCLASGQTEIGLRMGGSLSRFWFFSGLVSEGRDWLARLLAASRESTPGRARTLIALGVFARNQGDDVVGRSMSEEGLALAEALGDLPTIAWAA